MACSSSCVSACRSKTVSGVAHPWLCISSSNCAVSCCARFLLQPPESRSAHNAEQPGSRIPALERAEIAKRAQARLLNHVFRLVAAPHEPAREVMSRIEMRKDDLVKVATPCVDQIFVVHAVEFALVAQPPQWTAHPLSDGIHLPQ